MACRQPTVVGSLAQGDQLAQRRLIGVPSVVLSGHVVSRRGTDASTYSIVIFGGD